MKRLTVSLFLIAAFCISANAQRFDDYKAFSSGKGAITAVAYSPDGKTFASGNDQGMILIRDANTGDIVHILRNSGHTAEITHLDFYPGGQYLVSTARDGFMKVWELTQNKVICEVNARELSGKPDAFYKFAFYSPDGNVVLFGGTDGNINAMRPLLSGSKPGLILSNNGQSFTCADYAATGNYLVAGSKQGIKIIDFFSKKVIQNINACPDEVVDVKYTPDNTRIGSLCKNGSFSLWNATTGALIKSWKVTVPGPDTQIGFSPDGQYLVTGDTKNHVKVWDLNSMDINSDLTGHQAAVRSVDFAPNSKFIITGGNDDQIKMWQWRKVIENETLPQPPKQTEFKKPDVKDSTFVVNIGNRDKNVELLPPQKQAPELEKLKLTYTSRNIPDSLGDRKVVSGKRVIVDNEELELWVWDEEYEDGDTISVYFNDQWLIKEYPLTQKKRKIKITINRNADNYLVLYAHNEGSRPPNTAALTIFDGKKQNKVALSSNMRKCDAINFKFREHSP